MKLNILNTVLKMIFNIQPKELVPIRIKNTVR